MSQEDSKILDALAPQVEAYLKQHKEADDATLCTDPQDAPIASNARPDADVDQGS